MKIAPTSAATNRSGWKTPKKPASAVPTNTGEAAAGSVRGRAAISQMRTPLGISVLAPAVTGCHSRSRSSRELRVVRPAPLKIGVAALLGLLAHVEEEICVVSQLLDPGQPVLISVEARFDHPQGEWGQGEHLPAPGHRLLLEAIER